ncbi:DNA-(apurinic or apyrimidinic site) endonuclease [Anopheles ziemanni]|uniref:DNA-(apurinic or apyrimidinic site) endonuclease n=1 Tax=Anopheles coustani TaxID=139045 RepID=UPI002658895B|nr:DNA-(apurinic or apyrimidinic site) endonuclease [Anopheles coustani]XP_058177311.1 DNA-(apurinic or apyrimidinic site) endonuclease [Anopheles ziemanni]
MEDAPKKRGRQAAKAKETKTALPESEAGPVAVELSKGKGKRKAVSETPLAKTKKEAGTKKAKVDEPLPEETNEEVDTAAQANSEAPVAKKSRSKKDDAVKAAVVPKETKAPRKKAASKPEQAAPVDHDQQKNGSSVKEDQPPATKRNRGKPSYKGEESDEPEYIPKQTKGRGKAKDAKDDDDNASEKKPATKRAARTKEATDESSAPAKPTVRGRKKALIAEASVEDSAETFVTKRKMTSETEKAATSTASAKPAARGRKKALVAETTANVDDEREEKAATIVSSSNGVTQRKRSKDKTNGQEEDSVEVKVAPKGKKAKEAGPTMNKCATNFESLNFEPEVKDKEWNFKISSWNVAGLRAWVTKGGLEFLQHERPDILCVQETKCTEDQLPDEARQIPGYHPYWLCPKGGGAGVAIYSKKMPFHVSYGLGDGEHDQDGRLLTAEYEKFYLVCVYVPNAGRKLVTLPKRMRWDEKFQEYLAELNNKKPVILCGDMNVAHEEIDLANPKANRRNAGFTQEERDGMTKLLSLGFVDTFRRLYPDRERAYTFWTYMASARAKDIGWRLDYFILSERLVGKVVDNVIRSKVYGSDHCPITLFLNI